MAIFERFSSKKEEDERDDMIREIKQIYQEERLPIDEAKLRKIRSETPKIQFLTCQNKCPMILHTGDSVPRNCPYCGQTLRLFEKLQKENFQKNTYRKEIAAYAHFSFAFDNFHSGKLDVALSSLTRAIQLKPDFVDAYHNRSEVLIAKGDLAKAIEDCNHVIRLNPKDADAYLNRGSAKAQLGNFEEGVEDTTKALSLGFTGSTAFYNRGMCLVQLGQLKEASLDLDKFLELVPSDPRAEGAKKMMNLFDKFSD